MTAYSADGAMVTLREDTQAQSPSSIDREVVEEASKEPKPKGKKPVGRPKQQPYHVEIAEEDALLAEQARTTDEKRRWHHQRKREILGDLILSGIEGGSLSKKRPTFVRELEALISKTKFKTDDERHMAIVRIQLVEALEQKEEGGRDDL